eukprot:scaffold1026_cov409-Prasinococcus_capsulatus_cf.AAC.16
MEQAGDGGSDEAVAELRESGLRPCIPRPLPLDKPSQADYSLAHASQLSCACSDRLLQKPQLNAPRPFLTGRLRPAGSRARRTASSSPLRAPLKMVEPSYFFGFVKITEPETFANEYVSKVIPNIQEAGGKIILREEIPKALYSEREAAEHDVCIGLEFPTVEAGLAWYNSDSYKPLKAVRMASSFARLVASKGLRSSDGMGAFLLAFVNPSDMGALAEGYISKLPETCQPFGVEPIVRCMLPDEGLDTENAEDFKIAVMYGAPSKEVRNATYAWRMTRDAMAPPGGGTRRPHPLQFHTSRHNVVCGRLAVAEHDGVVGERQVQGDQTGAPGKHYGSPGGRPPPRRPLHAQALADSPGRRPRCRSRGSHRRIHVTRLGVSLPRWHPGWCHR